MGYYRSMPIDTSPSQQTVNAYCYSGMKTESPFDARLISFTLNSYSSKAHVAKGLNVVYETPSVIDANYHNVTWKGPTVYFDTTNSLYPRLVADPNTAHIYINAVNFFRNCGNMSNWSCLEHLNTKFSNSYSGMFWNCRNFNNAVTIGNNVTSCYCTFYGCSNFNQPVTIPNNVTTTMSMFINCYKFNQPITIPHGVTTCGSMFYGCSRFNQPIVIPNTVVNAGSMFYSCSNMSSDIYIKGTTHRNIYIYSMLGSMGYSAINIRRNVHFNIALNNVFNASTNGLVSNNPVWTPMTNGFYNEYYNIYCYYNYAG